MRKNLLLYILLVFLIVVNGFFLYNYLGTGEKNEPMETDRPEEFLVKELGFDKSQRLQFRELGKMHHQNMQGLSKDIRGLKDELFKGLSDSALKDVNIDSIAALIGEKEKAKDLEVFSHFKQVQELCNDKQKEKFSKIIKDALRRGDQNQGPPRGEAPNGNRPPYLARPDGNRPPPPEH